MGVIKRCCQCFMFIYVFAFKNSLNFLFCTKTFYFAPTTLCCVHNVGIYFKIEFGVKIWEVPPPPHKTEFDFILFSPPARKATDENTAGLFTLWLTIFSTRFLSI